MGPNLIMDEGSIEKEDGYTESTCLKLIPFDHRSADIVTANQKVGPGKPAERTLPCDRRPNVCQGIGTKVIRVSFLLRRLAKTDGEA